MTKINIFWSDSPLLVTKSSKWQMMEYGSFLCYEILMTASAALPPLSPDGRQQTVCSYSLAAIKWHQFDPKLPEAVCNAMAGQ